MGGRQTPSGSDVRLAVLAAAEFARLGVAHKLHGGRGRRAIRLPLLRFRSYRWPFWAPLEEYAVARPKPSAEGTGAKCQFALATTDDTPR
jgi:hypothetical protein